MIGTGFIQNDWKPYSMVLFLNGATYSRTLMTDARINGTSDDGRYYNVLYKGTFVRVPIEEVEFAVDYGYMVSKGLSPVAGWTEQVVDYSAYLG